MATWRMFVLNTTRTMCTTDSDVNDVLLFRRIVHRIVVDADGATVVE